MSNAIATATGIMLLLFSARGFGAPSEREPPWVKCGRLEANRQLDCYKKTTDQYLADKDRIDPSPLAVTDETRHDISHDAAHETAHDPQRDHDWKLDHLWPVGDEIANAKTLAGLLMQYRRNYLLVDSIHTPSDAPSSPNPLNQVPPGAQPHPSELKLQISLKTRLPIVYPWGDSVWFTYTQQSQWQAFNSDDSRPFRETNYEPELIFLSHRFDDQVPTLGALTPRLLNLTYVHQSNGQALPRSRSWNRLTAQLGSEYRFDDLDDRRFTVTVRPWWRVPDRRNNDDNPDIVNYLGHGDVTLDYWHDRDQYSLLLRERAVQMTWAFPFYSPALNSPTLYLQYFDGYGNSLIDYNHKLHSFGAGIALPF